ncbi:hypothetical protein GN958_ATG15881 [Phytophthora infestans]|uniref:Uncharacterized protein n=1 Tax=Phytophthora infestans TaxID=4787 RepID=A0A8S9U1Y9_PHYIN|nr:hypothetical protein GN958_ATG15881 [Phytophthora infestans]
MFLRSKANYETVVPPMRTFLSRWIVQSPANNIETGDVSAGGPTRVNCQPIRALPAIDRDTKYSRSKQLFEKIIDVMSLQPSTTFRLAMKWLEGFHTAIHTGQLEDFAGIEPEATPSVFPNLSQVLSPTASLFLNCLLENPPKKKLAANNAGSAAAPIVFGSPPKRIGLSKRAEKKEVSKKELKEAKRIQNCIREGKKVRAVKLCHMEILSGPYSSSTTRPLLDRLEPPSVEVVGPLVVRKYNVSQPVPVIKAIPQGEKIREAIQAIDDKGDQDLLARWDEYGCATYGQLKLMDLVVTAQNYFKMVKATMEWIDKVEFQVDSIVEPFKESVNITKVTIRKNQSYTEPVQN